MPYETIWEERGVYQRFSGIVTPRDREEANHEVMGDERFDALTYWIVDSLNMERYTLDSSEAVVAAAHDIGAARYNDQLLMVFVATNPEHRENIHRYIQVLESGANWQARLFDDLDSARQWVATNQP